MENFSFKHSISDKEKSFLVGLIDDKELASRLNFSFWGPFIETLIQQAKLRGETIKAMEKEQERLNQELEIRTGEYKHNKLVEAIEALKESNMKIEIKAVEHGR